MEYEEYPANHDVCRHGVAPPPDGVKDWERGRPVRNMRRGFDARSRMNITKIFVDNPLCINNILILYFFNTFLCCYSKNKS